MGMSSPAQPALWEPSFVLQPTLTALKASTEGIRAPTLEFDYVPENQQSHAQSFNSSTPFLSFQVNPKPFLGQTKPLTT